MAHRVVRPDQLSRVTAGDPVRSIASAGDLLIVGGQGHPAGERGVDADRYRALESFAREHWDVAEITHRCPLHCPYCSNPLALIGGGAELSTEDWKRVFTEARELGVLQLGLSGGEPLARRDVEVLAAHARRLGLYTTLVTSGVGLTRERATALRDAGLDHVQISIQDSDPESASVVTGSCSVLQHSSHTRS